ncbi:Predicted membrane-bound dolichyl-phosphate-mannose-protein mannosyltransferase [Actinomyces bovis]|uniref:Polyprenol-phosphate-mannose--protein mannosyltransferase n=1 Tax=Actinomyces bovis TaxID=1658 RepID=A0ABY1VN35_9ACTO|nr:phospholipid carrier-dependent glycosyltransferase [Actinomyces bovis]SPT53102.1 Predicted membrane-bound dolichyl-phosphate-mannose-protein mannosyltransferase [Actinomyces bovis]VEG56596.1 Predicted membrane-bound dolichyl-phosphate-mannose-protein mannosyltransferase [Actinomyces israelii]
MSAVPHEEAGYGVAAQAAHPVDSSGADAQLADALVAEDSVAAGAASGEQLASEQLAAARSENGLRKALHLLPVNTAPSLLAWRAGWVVTALVTLFAAVLRLVGLNHPKGLMFDEIYYVKDAYALWHNGYESQWLDGADKLFATGNFSALTEKPAFIVHPQLGKWLIALGMQLMGTGPVGWRFATAIAGTLTVLLLIRLTLRLTRSVTLAGVAGFLLAIDGVGLTESRIGLLDVFIGLFALLSLYFLVRDREWMRARIAQQLAGTEPGQRPRLAWFRPWLLACGISLGLTCSIKWSGIYLLAVVGILVVIWDFTALRNVGAARAWPGWLGGAVVDFVHLVVVAVLVYVAGWWSWFTHPGAYNHGWAAGKRAAQGFVARDWLPDGLNDWIEYHLVMWNFHVNLNSDHPYKSKPEFWLIQERPTSFYWPGEDGLRELGQANACGSNKCVQAITSVGNIPIWWSAIIALVVVIGLLVVARRDWRAWVPLAGYLGLYAPWFLYRERTIFTFYTVAFVPVVVLVLVLALGLASGLMPFLPGSKYVAFGSRRPSWYPVTPARMPILNRSGAPAGINRPRFDETSGDGTVIVPPARSGQTVGAVASQVGADDVPEPQVHVLGLLLLVVVVLAALVFAVLWWPLWTGRTISMDFWRWHMWFPTWI